MGEDIEKAPLEAMADDAVDAAQNGKVTIGDLLDSFGDRGFGPMLALCGLIAAIPPVGGIPGVPTTMGLLTVLLAGQIVFGRKMPWMPGFIRKLGVSKDKVEAARDKGQSIFSKIDSLIRQRMQWASGRAAAYVAALCCILLGLMMPPLELLPFAAAAPASAIVMFGLSLTARDGVLMIIAFVASAGSAALILFNLPALFN
ncbi:exopolysaccharide biosynthesis protein [Stakelama pacifica]|uniref:Exopolysaccharide synthesis protein ExoD n=1 Tax=Stakelama pacifica TaxID=517720 RepID=A0A4R6FJQ2_9SPHN|nr:exopolysaccharide biosynthesis protein [Stakelama pacifica]TDN81676.1 hypothetical protein EV664_10775 [Stakelama pacifica]GGO96234.1 hypothetical protein GCM10011329_22280 [Stakelama pacifica]